MQRKEMMKRKWSIHWALSPVQPTVSRHSSDFSWTIEALLNKVFVGHRDVIGNALFCFWSFTFHLKINPPRANIYIDK
jgi:hypothetical protein